jgi:malate dehydrogenase
MPIGLPPLRLPPAEAPAVFHAPTPSPSSTISSSTSATSSAGQSFGELGAVDPASDSPSRPAGNANSALVLQRRLRSQLPVVVAVHGATGRIGEMVANRVATGDMLSKSQVILRLMGRNRNALEGFASETRHSVHGSLAGVEVHTDLVEGFRGADYVILAAGAPRGDTQNRSDMLGPNAPIYAAIGQALNKAHCTATKVAVVANPANTLAWVVSQYAPAVPARNITAVTRLDQNRATSEVAQKLNMPPDSINNVAVWGNHSSALVTDIRYATADGQPVGELIADPTWQFKALMPTVRNLGAHIIKLSGNSARSSAANAAVDHCYALHHGSNGQFAVMAVQSRGEYHIPAGLWCSFPNIIRADGAYHVATGLDLTAPEIQAHLQASIKELQQEQAMAIKVLDADKPTPPRV